MAIRTALVSVSDKTGLVEFCRQLSQHGVQILSTGGTAKTLEQQGIPVIPVSQYTGSPEILDGRVKTLHPKIHGGILGIRSNAEHVRTMEEHGIRPIDMVVVNLYPFVRTIQTPGVTTEEAIEQIDIGGPSMIRSAAKNHNDVTVVVDPADYPVIIAQMKAENGETTEAERRRLAQKAFEHTSAYDAAIAAYFATKTGKPDELPVAMALDLTRESILRYGENPHQRAALYREGGPSGLVAARQVQGKQLSFNNYIDLEAASALASEFGEPFCAIIKHTNPCGAAIGSTLADAYARALESDPVAAYGSVIGVNQEVDLATAEKMSSLFIEAIIAPGYSDEALQLFSAKKNLRVMILPRQEARQPDYDFKRISGGFLVQDRDRFHIGQKDLRTVTTRSPEPNELADLLFAWRVCKHVKSNAILYAKDGRVLGVGAGQMSRVDSARVAVTKARFPLAGAAMASDAFFPFRDGMDEAAAAGIKAVIQPGGSVRDEEVIQAANEHGMAMVFTGIRHFKH